MLNVLNIYSGVCQLYIKKWEGKKRNRVQEKAALTISWIENKRGE